MCDGATGRSSQTQLLSQRRSAPTNQHRVLPVISPLLPAACSPSRHRRSCEAHHTHTHNNKTFHNPSTHFPLPTSQLCESTPRTAIFFSRAGTLCEAGGELLGRDDESHTTTTETGCCPGSTEYGTHAPTLSLLAPFLIGSIRLAAFDFWVADSCVVRRSRTETKATLREITTQKEPPRPETPGTTPGPNPHVRGALKVQGLTTRPLGARVGSQVL
jgi:hypothetical protein